MKNNKAVGYIRVSSAEQVNGTSLGNQEQAIRKYAQDNDLDMGEIYEDAGVSGKSMDGREGLQGLLKDSAHGLFQVMICYDIDRFGRDTVDIGLNRRILKENGVELKRFKKDPETSSG